MIHKVDRRVHQSEGTDWDPVESSEAGRADQAGDQEGLGGTQIEGREEFPKRGEEVKPTFPQK